MKITQTPSPNFDDRTLPISLLILHYTGMATGEAALERMCDRDAKVSAHYMVEEDGRIFRFPDVQINAVIALSKDIMKRHGDLTVLGHSDIAPARKIDPGENFPWQGLAAAGLGYWPNIRTDDRRILFELGTRDRGVAILQSGLAHIGYGARVSGVMDEETKLIIEAVQRRYRPEQIDGVVDIQTMDVIKSLVENYNSNAHA